MDPEPDPGKKVRSWPGQKDPDPSPVRVEGKGYNVVHRGEIQIGN